MPSFMMQQDKEVNGVINSGFIKDKNGDDDHFKDKHQSGPVSGKGLASQKSDKEKFYQEDNEEEPVDLSCGIWKFRTNRFGTKFANLYVFTLFVGVSMLFTQMVNSVLHVQLQSIERQFKIDNAKAGLFDTASKAGHLTTILLAGHFAKKVHIPVMIGLAGMFQGIILMIPAFMQIANPYTLPLLSGSGSGNSSNTSMYGDNEKYFCYTNSSENYKRSELSNTGGRHHQEPSDDYNQLAYIVIIIVQAVKGITDTFHSGFLPTLYVDDNMLDKARLGTFFGIKYVLGELASPLGSQLNAFLTTVPVDLKKTEMDTKDQRFVAAWWLSFLVFGAATTVFSFPIMLFPRKLVSRKQQQEALQRAVGSLSTAPEKDEKKIIDKVKADDVLRKPSITVIGVKDTINASDKHRRSFTPRSSVNRGSFYGNASSRRSSLFPPVDGPSERKVSIDGSMAFDQPIQGTPRKEKGTVTSTFKELIKDFPSALIRVLKRPVFLLMLVDIAIISIPMNGTSIFRTSYITNEYNVPTSEVATLRGITTAVSHVIGTLVSGWLATKVKAKMGYMWIILATYIINMFITPLYIVFGCDNEPIYGSDGRFGLPANVTDVCGCNATKQLISCGSDNLNYLTPCHAGCLSSVGKTFTNCSGLVGLALNQSLTLVPGLCPTPCRTNLYLYIGLHAFQGMISSAASIPRRLFILRIVDPRDRAFGTSLFAFFGTILALPSPNLFGRIMDDFCLVKDGTVCTIYDRDRIRYLISGVDVGTHACIQITFMFMMCIFRWEERKMKKKTEEEKEKGGTGNKELDGKI